jgi:cysteine sulfinate desulfinase/cysteine desulfurase-like protein
MGEKGKGGARRTRRQGTMQVLHVMGSNACADSTTKERNRMQVHAPVLSQQPPPESRTEKVIG